LPQFAILPIALFLVWLALARGLSPIALLQSKIRARQPDDLSPIANNHIPQEISPLVQSLNDMLARLEAAIAQQKRFIADAAHQMKTPLAGMQMQAELALRDAAQNNVEEVQRSLQQLARSSENATHLVNQLLSLARAENQGQAITAHVKVDIGLLAKQVITDWVATALAKQIDLGLEEAEEPPGKLWILGNPMLLRELISNLLDNALRYTPAGGIVTLRLSRQAQQIVLEVEDNGPGIAEPERELVLQRFYRILGNQAQGSGLGLAIVREIAQQHHASLSLHAAPSQPEEHLGDPKRPGCLVRIAFIALMDEENDGSTEEDNQETKESK
jgi:two-component system sensor histidine kinase TctE